MNISNISTLIREYYSDNLASLPFEKQFHFHGRLWLWSGNKESETWLQQHKEKYIESFPKNIPESPQQSQKYDGIRIPILKKFPAITTYVKMLAVCLHTKNLYGKHISIPSEHLPNMQEYYNILLQSPRDLAILSTIGVNFLYMYSVLVKKSGDTPYNLPDHMLRIAKEEYNTTHNEIQLELYLITHSIIGETQFYKKPIRQHQNIYQQMILRAEELLEKNYAWVQLDIKFEFLVCNALCKHETFLKERIHEQAGISFSPIGNFLIDSPDVNHNNSKKNSPAASEHRNVLFLMSTTAYNPPEYTL